MPSDIKHKLPIGWYLKEADSLITQYINNAFEVFGINRFHWQVLKQIDTHGKISRELYYYQVNRFLTEAELDEILDSLVARNWVQHNDDLYSFTPLGAAEFAKIADDQDENYKKILNGTSIDAYLATIDFLEIIIKNMGGKI
ncbi:MAG: hypothetical protein J7623_15690 [Chitinophaga sp.]|uniref:hypothetical protein n=1 Tax=Chitinophaga sp. TaxID=1869181 RepID=UPI001B10B819|nr:hypothetical protein [Chitinophaga sp.]MBO9730080.1 hypothetical protein [Chitinophaga sp.]